MVVVLVSLFFNLLLFLLYCIIFVLLALVLFPHRHIIGVVDNLIEFVCVFGVY